MARKITGIDKPARPSVRSPSPSKFSPSRTFPTPRESGPRRWLVPFVESAYSALVPREQAEIAVRAIGRGGGSGGAAARRRAGDFASRLQPGRGEDVLATPGDTFWVDRAAGIQAAQGSRQCAARARRSARPARADRARRAKLGAPWSVGGDERAGTGPTRRRMDGWRALPSTPVASASMRRRPMAASSDRTTLASRGVR